MIAHSEPLVKVRRLTKIFGERPGSNGSTPAVDNIDFDIWPGEIVGFLGPNGAGKTTTIRMMMNLLNPTSGEMSLFGKTFAHDRTFILSRMNASSGTLTLPGKLSVDENLLVFADMYGIPRPGRRVEALIERFDLKDLRGRSLYSLSTGQQVRVALAKAFLNQPKLLLLDEPTSSLDPDVADRVRSFLLDVVKQEDTTVFLTSHNMLEVEKVCSRVLFLNNGRIQAEGTPKELARRLTRWTLRIKTDTSHLSPDRLPFLKEITASIEQHAIVVDIDQSRVGPFLTELVKGGIGIESLSIHEPTLEDFFVHSARQEGR